jgi:hypothetical protein
MNGIVYIVHRPGKLTRGTDQPRLYRPSSHNIFTLWNLDYHNLLSRALKTHLILLPDTPIQLLVHHTGSIKSYIPYLLWTTTTPKVPATT